MNNPLSKPYSKCSECNRKLNNVWVKIVRQDKKKLTTCCFYSILSKYKLVETDKILNLGGFKSSAILGLAGLFKEVYGDDMVSLIPKSTFLDLIPKNSGRSKK